MVPEVVQRVAVLDAESSDHADRMHRATLAADWVKDPSVGHSEEYRCVVESSANPVYGAQTELNVKGTTRE